MNKKEKEQLLELLKSGIKVCLPNNDEFGFLRIVIDKMVTKPENIKLIRKWISED